MIAVISLLLVVTISMIVIRVASVALVHTGMGREAARFQARSAFTGAGFTAGLGPVPRLVGALRRAASAAPSGRW